MKFRKTTAALLIAIFLISMFAVGVQAMHFLGLNGGYLSVTSEAGVEPEETVLGDVVGDAQSGTVTIEGTISDLYVASGGWPDTAYLEIGVRPEATKDETNAGIYMIVLASQTEGILCIHLQDYGGQRPIPPLYPAYIPVENAEKIDYRITLEPSGEFGGTAYLELWDMDGAYQEAPSQVYGYSDASTLDEDFSEARLFYSLMAEKDGEPDIPYSATVGDITTNIPGLYHREDFVPGNGKGLYKPLPNDNFAKGRQQEDFYVVAELEGPVVLLDVKGVQKFDQEGLLYDAEENEIGAIDLSVSITNVYEALRGGYARASVHFVMDFYARTDLNGTIVGKIWFDEYGVQHVEGNFVGRGSHVKGTVELLEPDVLLFDGKEW